MIQLWRGLNQARTNFEDAMSKEYREIIRRIPYKALIGADLMDDEKELAYNEIFNYMDLCNEQVFLRMSGRVRRKVWKSWQEGMETNFSLKIFEHASNEIISKLPNNFKELQKVQSRGYRTDPRYW